MTHNPLRQSLPAACAAALLLAACGELTTVPLDETPTVEARAASAQAGQSIPLRIHNPTEVTWTYGLCPGAFQRFMEGVWVEVPPALILCTADVTVISPGETVDGAAFLTAEAPAGAYRAVVPFGTAGQNVVRTSNTFTVEALAIGAAPIVSVLQASAARGTAVTVRLFNPTTYDFGYNLCPDGRLQRLVGDDWTDTAEPLWLCLGVVYPLDAGGLEDESYPVFDDLVPGTYRMRVRLWLVGGDAVTRFSNSFTVN